MKSKTIFIATAVVVVGAASASMWLFNSALLFKSPPSEVADVGRTARMKEIQQLEMEARRREAEVVEERRPSALESRRRYERSSQISHAPPAKGFQGGLDAVDKILDSLPSGNIAFNTPPAMNLTDTAIIQLKLDLARSIEELKRTIEAEGQKEGARIKVADRMEARLSGPNFTITQVTPEQQAVTQGEVTEWTWEVKPTAEGRHHLHLTLSALLSIDGASTQRAIRTFDKFIAVDVTWPQRVSLFVQGNWQWLWAVFLAPFAGWGWNRWSRSKDRSRPTSSCAAYTESLPTWRE
ncbi:MAG: hypothetical protein U1E25_04035 [Methylocystis sp.]